MILLWFWAQSKFLNKLTILALKKILNLEVVIGEPSHLKILLMVYSIEIGLIYCNGLRSEFLCIRAIVGGLFVLHLNFPKLEGLLKVLKKGKNTFHPFLDKFLIDGDIGPKLNYQIWTKSWTKVHRIACVTTTCSTTFFSD